MSKPESLKYTIDYGITYECVPASDPRLSAEQVAAMELNSKSHAIIISPPTDSASEIDKKMANHLLGELASNGRVIAEKLLLKSPDAKSNAYVFLASESLVMAALECGLMSAEKHNEIRTDMRLYTGMDAGDVNVSDMIGSGFGIVPQKPPSTRRRIGKKLPSRGGRT